MEKPNVRALENHREAEIAEQGESSALDRSSALVLQHILKTLPGDTGERQRLLVALNMLMTTDRMKSRLGELITRHDQFLYQQEEISKMLVMELDYGPLIDG